MTVTIKGEAGHAGTVPMGARKDALLAASECILAVEAIAARNPEAVGTVGEIDVSPGATNVIPGKVAFSVDVRAADDDVRSAMVAELIDEMNRIVAGRTVGLSISSTHDAGSVACAPWLIGEIETAMTELDLEPRRLPSGAGHDAAAMSAITDVGMIFIRCAGGISHNPAESITEDDARLATRLLLQTVENIATGLQSEQPVAQ